MRRLRFLFVLPVLLLALVGCTSVERTVAPGRDPAVLREVFVVTNFNDNHGLARRIAAALREKGLSAEHGPLTLLPKSAEAVVHYQDRWAWDFGEHLVYLQLSLSDPGELRPYATATRSKHIERSTDLAVVVPELVAELLAPVGKK
ncbi:MAG: hypothetical protein H7067_01730 [Burkholderiales bacterium]|nr:hypothetical protein [Opitutaceae bacterium]